jgi:hypothetical protein
MSIDVLAYNALNANIKPIRANASALLSCITTTNNCIDSINVQCESALNTIATNSVALVANAGPNQAHLWCYIPTLPATGCPWTGGVFVCDASGLWNCGSCCAWTVPAGVTCARFQIWGAGAGTGFSCCCAFTPFGGTGAYASVIMPVTAGSVYTLCGGCAFCCCATAGGTNNVAGCASFVTGTGLTNFCAQGGEGDLYCQRLTRCACIDASCTFLGGCICSNNSICWAVSTPGTGGPGCCFDLMLPMISSCKTFFGSATGGTVYGIRGSFGAIAVNCNATVRVQHPPIYGFSTTSCCCCIITSNYASGWCRSAQNGFLRVPGAGGFAHFKCGGGTSNAGDRGKFGAVCVSFI